MQRFNGKSRKLSCKNFHAFSKLCYFQSTVWAVGIGKYLNDVFFRQKKGTAIGTKFAPTYDTLTVGYLKGKLYEQRASDFRPTFREEFENTWKRFLDDCFILWSKSKYDLQKFHSMLHNLPEDVHFTIESSKTELPFLDVMIRNIDGLVETDIFYKPTDSKLYLLFQFCQPKHNKTSISFSLARRLRCVVSNAKK